MSTTRSSPPAAYAELQCQSAFSFLRGASEPEALVERAAELGYAALALTDRDGLYGSPRFHLASKAAGLPAVHGTTLQSLSKAVSTEDDHDYHQLEDIVDDPTQTDALEVIESEQAREVLLETIDGLPEQQRLVVALYYYEEMTLKEIGEALHISESRVSQIHTRAVKTLKARLARVL